MRAFRPRLALVLGLVSILATVPASRVRAAIESQGSIHFTIGTKTLAGDTVHTRSNPAPWVPNDSQIGLGAEASWGLKRWPVLLALDVLQTSNDASQSGYQPFTYGPNANFETEASTWELGFGLRTAPYKRWGLRPYVGAGGALIRATANAQVVNREDPEAPILLSTMGDNASAFGYWVGGGFLWGIGKRLDLGLTFRYSKAQVDLTNFGLKLEAGGTHVGLAVGWSWPR
jgi:opacity protein-like surface antigen